MAKAGTVAELHPELGAETDAAAGTAAGGRGGAADIDAAAEEVAAGEAAVAPCRGQAAGAALSHQPCEHLGGLFLVDKQ